MPIYVTTIKQIESEFDDIYRITAENGLILDISEYKKPVIGSTIEYYINEEKNNSEYTIMNGTVFVIQKKNILVSFGGLLGTIPLDESIIKSIDNNIILSYKLL